MNSYKYNKYKTKYMNYKYQEGGGPKEDLANAIEKAGIIDNTLLLNNIEKEKLIRMITFLNQRIDELCPLSKPMIEKNRLAAIPSVSVADTADYDSKKKDNYTDIKKANEKIKSMTSYDENLCDKLELDKKYYTNMLTFVKNKEIYYTTNKELYDKNVIFYTMLQNEKINEIQIISNDILMLNDNIRIKNFYNTPENNNDASIVLETMLMNNQIKRIFEIYEDIKRRDTNLMEEETNYTTNYEEEEGSIYVDTITKLVRFNESVNIKNITQHKNQIKTMENKIRELEESLTAEDLIKIQEYKVLGRLQISTGLTEQQLEKLEKLKALLNEEKIVTYEQIISKSRLLDSLEKRVISLLSEDPLILKEQTIQLNIYIAGIIRLYCRQNNITSPIP